MTDFGDPQRLVENTAVLAQRDPELAEKLQNTDIPADIALETCKDGSPILVYRGRPLYSRYRALTETQRWVEKGMHRDCNAAIFAGFGLGYQLESFVRLRSKGIMILVEPSLPLFKAALCVRDLTGLLQNPRLHWSIGSDAEVSRLLHLYSDRIFHFYYLQAFQTLLPDFYNPLQKKILNLLNRFRVNSNTLKRFGPLWIRNISLNMNAAANSSNAGIFYRNFQSFPFLLAAAGPSLEHLLPHIEELQQRLVIVAVDTALNLLLQRGVEPDFVVSVDPQLLNARHYDHSEAPSSILIAEACIHPLIFRKAWRHRSIFHSTFPLMEELEKSLGPLDKVRSGGSVATAAWDFIQRCRPQALYTAGMDLSYPTLRSHCRGTMIQRYSFTRASRVQTAEHLNWRVTVSAGALRVPAYDGSKVLSDKRMDVYRNWLEDQLALEQRAPNYSIGSDHSARINGITPVPLDQVLSLPRQRAAIDLRIREILAPVSASNGSGRPQGKVAAQIESLIAGTRDLYLWSHELLSLLSQKRLNKQQENRIPQLQQNIAQSPARSLVSFFFADSLSRIVSRSPQQEKQGQLEQDRIQIYRQFHESSKFHLYWLQVALRQLEGKD